MNVLDLFSGIGGFSLGLERAGMKTVAFCEIDPFCRKVLRKHWPDVPIFEDVRTLRAADVGAVDVICGGFPCQPYSVAGKRLAAEDDRALWPEYRRLVEELRPACVVGENVIGLVGLGLDAIVDDLETLGYSVRTFDIPACAVGARHIRRRIWIVAYANGFVSEWQRSGGDIGEAQGNDARRESAGASNADAANANGRERSFGGTTGRVGWREQIQGRGHWEIASEPFVRRGTHGIPNRMDRIAALGNAVVPQIPEIIGRAILQCESSAP